MPKSMYDVTARERYEKRKNNPALEKPKYPWLKSIGLLSIFSFVTSVLTAYTTWIKQSDDLRVITDRIGQFRHELPDGPVHVSGGPLTLINLGNRNVVVTSVIITISVNSLADSPCRGRLSWTPVVTDFKPVALKPGDLTHIVVAFQGTDEEADKTRDTIEVTFSNVAPTEMLESCVSVSYATPERVGFEELFVMRLRANQHGGVQTFKAMRETDHFSPRSVIRRNRTTVPILNDAIDWVTGTK